MTLKTEIIGHKIIIHLSTIRFLEMFEDLEKIIRKLCKTPCQ